MTSAAQALVQRIYQDCNRILGREKLDYVFVMHWFRMGGSELETLLLINAITRLRPDLKIALITTENTKGEWLYRLPDHVIRLEFGKKTAKLPAPLQLKLLHRLLKAKRPRVIHNVISELCWELFKKDGKRLAARSKLVASSFCISYYKGQAENLTIEHLPLCRKQVAAVITDNERHAAELKAQAQPQNVISLRFPVHNMVVKPRPRLAKRRRLKVFWAGRMDTQKRLDVLYAVALSSPAHDFHVWGQFVAQRSNTSFYVKKLRLLNNVTLHEAFHHLEELPLEKFDAFLYTAAWDGVPNILIEVASMGIPIIAPDVGGVSELINSKTGFLVSKADAIREYRAALEVIQQNPTEALRRARAAQAFLRKKHSNEGFERKIKAYLKGVRL